MCLPPSRHRGTTLSEVMIVVLLLAITAIFTVSVFGQRIRDIFAVSSNSLAGGSGEVAASSVKACREGIAGVKGGDGCSGANQVARASRASAANSVASAGRAQPGSSPSSTKTPSDVDPMTGGNITGPTESANLSIVHDVLNVVSFVPGVGAVPSVLNAGVYAFEGNYKDAAWSAVEAIPGIKWVKAGALAVKAGKVVNVEKVAAKETKLLKEPNWVTCFVAGTPIDTDDGAKAIEAVALGDRVGTESAQCAELRTEDWSEVDLRMVVETPPAGVDELTIRLLRPKAWLEENHIAAGSDISMSLDELNIAGSAYVTDIGPAPKVKQGARCPVTGRVRHVSPEVISVGLQGGTRLELTKHHPLFSADRNDWVEAGALVAGERLSTRDGVARVEAISNAPRALTEVFNLEIYGEHRYFAGALKVLAHNGCAAEAPKSGGGRAGIPDKLPGRPTPEQQALIDMAKVDSKRIPRGKGPISSGDADAYVELANKSGVPVRAKPNDLSGAHGYGPVPRGPGAEHIHINGEHVPVPPGYQPPQGSTVIR